MKLSVVIADDSAAPDAFVVWRGFEESIKKAGAMGFDGVELALKKADDIDRRRLDKLLEENRLEVSCISTGQVFSALKLTLTHPDQEVRSKAVNVYKELILLAKDYGKMVNIGRARGFVASGQTREKAEQLFLEGAGEIADFAAGYGVDIVIEPVNRYEINFINNLDEGGALLKRLGRENAGLMPDVFHMNIEDASIGRSLEKNSKWIKYLHLADSNRYAPGWGHLDFKEVFEALRKTGYDGWMSVEILPCPGPDEAAAQAVRYLRPLVDQVFSEWRFI